jgi:hypothetical protein
MDRYNALIAPDPENWLRLEEGERVEIVSHFHKKLGQWPGGSRGHLHAVFHVIIENQLAEGLAPLHAALTRLLNEGLDRHEAIHALGSVLIGHLTDMLKEHTVHDPEKYRQELEQLTAAKWRASG